MPDTRVFELAFTIMEKLVQLKDFESKDDLMGVAQTALDLIENDETVSNDIKDGYRNAIKRMSIMTWDELQNIKSHI